MIRLGALFAGVGGLELGLENAFKVAGVRAETVYQVELDDAARKVLKRLKMIGNAVSPVVSYVLGLELIRIIEEAFVEQGL